jgi:hypothetical protein
MKFISIFFLVFLTVKSSAQTKKNSILRYSNLIIISDLSSRIRNQKYPLKDSEEINKIIIRFRDEIVRPGQKLGDLSCISFHTFSEIEPYIIDLSKYPNIGERQQFINSTGNFRNKGLQFQLDNFKKYVNSIYSKHRNEGLDLISFLMEKIENKIDIKSIITKETATQKVISDYENHIFILTDGYLEFKSQINLQYYFGEQQILKLRKFCKEKNIDPLKALQINPSLGLPVSRSNKNPNINLHILETHERDKDIKLLTYSNERGLRDNEILEAVWRRWAMQSGFKSFEWKKY